MSAALRAYAERETPGHPANNAAAPVETTSTTASEAPLVGKRVTISGILARPELNGSHGRALSFDEAKSRYTVALDNGRETLALKASNLTVAHATFAGSDASLYGAGTRVRIRNLTSSLQLNECGGTVVEWLADKERYVVELDGWSNTKKILLRPSNLERDRRERWTPEMPSAANLAHIQREQQLYYEQQAAQSNNPFASLDPTGEVFESARQRQRERAEADATAGDGG